MAQYHLTLLVILTANSGVIPLHSFYKNRQFSLSTMVVPYIKWFWLWSFSTIANCLQPACVWSIANVNSQLQWSYYIAKLWTVVPKMDMNICHICQNQYVDMFIHATVSCTHTVELRDMFWCDIIENFNLELCAELAGLDSDQLYAILIGKRPSTELDEQDVVDFTTICFKFVRASAALYRQKLNSL